MAPLTGIEAWRGAVAALLATIMPVAASAITFDDTPPARPAWAAEYKIFDALPLTITYLVSIRQHQTGTFLVAGARPTDDRPGAGRRLLESPARPGGWVFEDGTAAIRVTGVPPPEPGKRIVLAARFADGAEPALVATKLVAAARPEGRTVLRPGELVLFPLPSTKSYSCYVELSGDAASVESAGYLNGVIVRALRPGTVTAKILAEWWNRPEPERKGEFTVAVEPFPPGMAPAPKGPDRRWLAELTGAEGVGFTTYPNPIGWQADHPDSYKAAFLVIGARPAGDQPPEGLIVRGRRRNASDWVVADMSGAIWVSGLPAPEAGKTVLLSGRLSAQGGATSLDGIRFLTAGSREGTTTVGVGELVYYPLAGTKETTCPVEIEGDAVEVAYTDQRDALIVRAVKPGDAKIRIFTHWFDSDASEPQGERLLTVR